MAGPTPERPSVLHTSMSFVFPVLPAALQPQNFGVFAAPESVDNMKASWLVHSIHTLRQKHPTLKVGVCVCDVT